MKFLVCFMVSFLSLGQVFAEQESVAEVRVVTNQCETLNSSYDILQESWNDLGPEPRGIFTTDPQSGVRANLNSIYRQVQESYDFWGCVNYFERLPVNLAKQQREAEAKAEAENRRPLCMELHGEKSLSEIIAMHKERECLGRLPL